MWKLYHEHQNEPVSIGVHASVPWAKEAALAALFIYLFKKEQDVNHIQLHDIIGEYHILKLIGCVNTVVFFMK